MAADAVLSQELRVLLEELAALHKKRSLRSEGRVPATDAKLNSRKDRAREKGS